jgi:predicted AAA+ superfamily ATPase
MIKRNIQAIIEKWLFRGKVIIIYGARQVGKTTLVKALLDKYDVSDGYFNCEIQSVRALLAQEEPIVLKQFLTGKKLVVFDEAQNIPNIGLILKLLNDTYPDIQIIATGSSSFELANKTNEPLTGRALQFTLFPFSYEELGRVYNPLERKALLEKFLQFGHYPEIVLSNQDEIRLLLDDLSSKYLYKDILEFETTKTIRYPVQTSTAFVLTGWK